MKFLFARALIMCWIVVTWISRLYRVHRAGGFFVVRCKEPVSFKTVERKTAAKDQGIQCDQVVRLKSNCSAKSYPELMRRIRSQDLKRKGSGSSNQQIFQSS